MLTFALARSMLRQRGMLGLGKRFVYILRSDSGLKQSHYVGVTSDVDERLAWHNARTAGYTVAKRPWSIVVSLEFPTEMQAVRFEKYLKSGSGRAFAKRLFGDAAQNLSKGPIAAGVIAFAPDGLMDSCVS